ncbi:MAG: hypothetical protein KAR44_12770 [Candidatus Aegiribacteria sp.]|nr:hypothetical protein [Candidatus Aegiribacteria sp.]
MMLGPAGKALAAGPESVTGNPAMIVSGFTAAGGRWNLQTTGISVAGGFSAGSDVSISGGLIYLGRGGILRRDETGSVTGEYSFGAGTALAGASFPLASWLRGGISAGVSWENIAEQAGTGLTCSAGLSADFQNGMKAGIAICGIGQAPSWNGIRKNMPTEVSAGVSYPLGSLLTGFAGGRIGFSTSDAFGGGLKVEYADLGFSAGYSYAPGEDEISGFFAGAQYVYTSEGTYTIEAAVSRRDDLGWPVYAGISISL